MNMLGIRHDYDEYSIKGQAGRVYSSSHQSSNRFTVFVELPPMKRTISSFTRTDTTYYRGQFPYTYFLLEIANYHGYFWPVESCTYISNQPLKKKTIGSTDRFSGKCRPLFSVNRIGSNVYTTGYKHCMNTPNRYNLWDACEDSIAVFFETPFVCTTWYSPAVPFHAWEKGQHLHTSMFSKSFQFNCINHLTKEKLTKFDTNQLDTMLNNKTKLQDFLESL